jgi:hypothetical protein
MGGNFAANLSRVGEKDNYDYLVRWVHNPRQRTRPYSPFEKKRYGPGGLRQTRPALRFRSRPSARPNDGHELVVQQPTVMPSLRLSDRGRARHRQLPDDPEALRRTICLRDLHGRSGSKPKGKARQEFYGCAGCHEISGMEDEGRIGTELTNEGSKPIERLDFALWTDRRQARRFARRRKISARPVVRPKGFFEHKLTNPAIYDQGKYTNPLDALRMPKPNIRVETGATTHWSPCCSAAPIHLCRRSICIKPPTGASGY